MLKKVIEISELSKISDEAKNTLRKIGKKKDLTTYPDEVNPKIMGELLSTKLIHEVSVKNKCRPGKHIELHFTKKGRKAHKQLTRK